MVGISSVTSESTVLRAVGGSCCFEHYIVEGLVHVESTLEDGVQENDVVMAAVDSTLKARCCSSS